MYALQREPEAGRRWRILSAGAVLSTLLYGSILGATSRLKRPEHTVQPERIEMRVIKMASSPMPEDPKPKPKKETPEPKKEIAPPTTPANQPQPTAAPMPLAESATEPPIEPEPLVLGLTLSSTTRSGKGPKFAVGNTLMGTPGRVARAPRAGGMAYGKAPTPPAAAPKKAEKKPRVRSSSKSHTAAKLRRSTTPHYPSRARHDGIEGVVILSITIDVDGRVESARVLRGLGHGLDESALRAARSTVWAPATVDGRSIRTTRRFNVRFTLQG